MKLLLDTHTFIWWDSDPARLSSLVRELCEDPANSMLLSVASVWEMQIKAQLGRLMGRLTLDAPLADVVRSQQDVNELEVVPVTLEHLLALESLPAHHKDPFDRLLIAQAITEDAVLLSRDALFANYGIDVRW